MAGDICNTNVYEADDKATHATVRAMCVRGHGARQPDSTADKGPVGLFLIFEKVLSSAVGEAVGFRSTDCRRLAPPCWRKRDDFGRASLAEP